MKRACPHKDLKFLYKNVAGNNVHSCQCGMVIIKKPDDERLYTLDANVQLVEIS